MHFMRLVNKLKMDIGTWIPIKMLLIFEEKTGDFEGIHAWKVFKNAYRNGFWISLERTVERIPKFS